MTITFPDTQQSYLDRLKKQSALYVPPGLNNSRGNLPPKNPNNTIDGQQQIIQGFAPVPASDPLNADGIQQREDLTAQKGDIANQDAQAQLAQRQKQYTDSITAPFSGGLGNNGGMVDGSFTGSGAVPGLDAEQMANARRIAEDGQKRGASQDEIQTALMTAMTESSLRNLSGGDRDSVGLFQQRASQGWGSVAQISNPDYAANKFYDAYEHSAKGANPWNTAQNVQRSAFSDGSNYQKNYGLSQQIYQAIHTGGQIQNVGNNVSNPGLNSWIHAFNNRYIDYDHAYGNQCVDLYAYYTTGFVGGKPLPVGYAPEIFHNYDTSAYTRFGSNQSAHSGDVAIWGVGPYTRSGHVAVVVGDNGNGTLRVLQSNATALGSAGNTVISNISKAALMGYLRPNKLMGR